MAKKNIYMDDYWSKKARIEGYRARSYYKLEELDKKFKIIFNDYKILDLGAAPGSWTQYALKKKNTKVIAIDIKDIEPFENEKNRVRILKKNIFDVDFNQFEKFNLIMSDMAPNTTGIRDIDSTKSMELIEKVLEIAKDFLENKGVFVCKFLQGVAIEDFIKNLKKQSFDCKIYKPRSTRKNSVECYFIGKKIQK